MNPFHGINEEFNPQFAVEPATNTRRLAIRCIEADLVDGMFALPGQLFYGTQIPDCLWFLAKNNAADAKRGSRDRRVQTLILGTLIDRVHRELTDAETFELEAGPCWRANRRSRQVSDSAKKSSRQQYQLKIRHSPNQ